MKERYCAQAISKLKSQAREINLLHFVSQSVVTILELLDWSANGWRRTLRNKSTNQASTHCASMWWHVFIHPEPWFRVYVFRCYTCNKVVHENSFSLFDKDGNQINNYKISLDRFERDFSTPLLISKTQELGIAGQTRREPSSFRRDGAQGPRPDEDPEIRREEQAREGNRSSQRQRCTWYAYVIAWVARISLMSFLVIVR